MTNSRVTVVPAYGRDYKSLKAVKEAWDSGKDFQIASVGPHMGRYISKRDCADLPLDIWVRYSGQTKIAQLH